MVLAMTHGTTNAYPHKVLQLKVCTYNTVDPKLVISTEKFYLNDPCCDFKKTVVDLLAKEHKHRTVYKQASVL